ncbi:hypothetical protein CRG98_042845, partial [Punica granatum]
MEVEEEQEETSSQISLHALLGTRSFQTMRLVGTVGKRLLHVLVDSGSTHNFLNEEVGRKLNCHTELMPTVKVAVANGNELKCERVCKKFRWRMQGKEYEADMLLLPLESYDIVLGEESILQGCNSEELRNIREEQMEKLLQKRDQLAQVQLCTLEVTCTSKVQLNNGEGHQKAPGLAPLLKEFEDIFREPKAYLPKDPRITGFHLRKGPSQLTSGPT